MTHRTCKIDGCERKHYGRGYCSKHWQRLRTHGDPNYVTKHIPKKCKESGCSKTQIARGWCQHHYDAWRIHGDPLHHEKNQKPTICAVNECGKTVEFLNWCEPHYRKNLWYGDPEYVAPKRKRKICSIGDCSRTAIGRGWCEKHYRRWRRFGDPLGRELVICRTCGQPFMSDGKRTINCSTVCTIEDRQRNTFGYRQRKGRLKEAFVEVVSRPILYARDNWVCGVCGKDVDKYEEHPSPWSPSLDHIVPLSKGGEHSYKNCQLAHLRCNLQKGDRMD